MERLTNEIEERAQAYIARIDELGGALRATELGYIQREIQEAAYRLQQEIEAKERIVVGVNEYLEAEEHVPEILRVDPAVVERQIRRLEALRAQRDAARVEEALAALAEAAAGEANVMPRILAAVEAGATLGEIADTLREVFGEYQPATVF